MFIAHYAFLVVGGAFTRMDLQWWNKDTFTEIRWNEAQRVEGDPESVAQPSDEAVVHIVHPQHVQSRPKLHIDLVQTEFHITLQHSVSAALETQGKTHNIFTLLSPGALFLSLFGLRRADKNTSGDVIGNIHTVSLTCTFLSSILRVMVASVWAQYTKGLSVPSSSMLGTVLS
ncbi:hypothetical protein E2C01_007230 [Portunus trituberculatus]|uniref:Uncharacterized protein n=1 Tax=Portunus trituberculatus TaxID=210409 RepID=A0A5B7CXL6_PORTR|nr:hypothetical protein [Portunus trituberculatus]